LVSNCKKAHCQTRSRSGRRYSCTARSTRIRRTGRSCSSTSGSRTSGTRSIALALVGNPEVAILDELTTGLDPQARRDTWALIEGVRDRGVTVVLVTHFMEEAERLCDRVALIDGGRLVAIDTPARRTRGKSGHRTTHPIPAVGSD
jgi:ABC-type Na+ transport system ATPase subunit NatA